MKRVVKPASVPSAKETLERMLAWLKDGRSWCQGKAAMNKHGKETGVNGEDAVKWCAWGWFAREGMDKTRAARLALGEACYAFLHKHNKPRLEQILACEYLQYSTPEEWNGRQRDYVYANVITEVNDSDDGRRLLMSCAKQALTKLREPAPPERSKPPAKRRDRTRRKP